MNPVHLTRVLELEDPVEVGDGAGGMVLSWVALGSLWAEVIPAAGHEAAGEEVRLARVGYRITVRGAVVGAASRPKPEQRFRDGTRVFTILAVTERDAGGQYLTCFAREEVPA